MKFSIIGAGSFGATIGQTLIDNGHEVLLFDISKEFVLKINNEHRHPFFDVILPKNLIATNSYLEISAFSSNIILATPAKAIRETLKILNGFIKNKTLFISVAKGLEPETMLPTSEIIKKEIDEDKLEGYVYLSGPCHAEELILRKVTAMVSFSKDIEKARFIQEAFSNNYLRIYTSDDVIGAEIAAAVKNTIAVASGIAFGYGLGENARAALITRGSLEILQIVDYFKGSKETVYGLAGIGDLIVTCSSFNSRNFTAGKQIGEGKSVENVLTDSKMVVEGLRTIEACYSIGQINNMELPLIYSCYNIIKGHTSVKVAMENLFLRDLKKE